LTARVAVTFDNLGEVTALERGEWPEGEPLGRHPSVTEGLPRVLELLEELGLRATFFVEGLNTELYPEALREIAAAGHEVGYHGWRHEPWGRLDAARERAVLERGVAALDALGLRPVGFRPPGGELLATSARALADLGFAYASPCGEAPGTLGGVAVLPFRWPLVDALHYLPRFADRRAALLGAPGERSPDQLRATMEAALRERPFTVLVFHPFLADTPERVAALGAVLGTVRALVEAGDARCAPLRELASD
jgi:peptidoglycan/xylan/chitin deacetylase (PgdA/CDA1 family)